jgi:hypothetical protein
MPFKIITTVIHEGRPDMSEELIVHTTGGKRICTVSRGRDGSKRYMIRTKDWPKPVRQAAEELAGELRHRGKAVDLPDITAWIDSKRGLVVGEKIHVFLAHEESARNKTIILRGTITRFTVP